MIGQRLGADRFDQWVRALRLRHGRPASTCPASSRGIVLAAQGLLRLLDGQPADRPGRGGDADADGRRPTRRSPTAASCARRGSSRRSAAGRRRRRAASACISDRRRRAQLRDMLEGVLGPGGTASGAAIAGYVLAGKTGTAEKPDPVLRRLLDDEVRRVVRRLRARRRTRGCCTLVMVDEPQGDIYGGSVAAPAWRDIMSFALQLPAHPAEVGAWAARRRSAALAARLAAGALTGGLADAARSSRPLLHDQPARRRRCRCAPARTLIVALDGRRHAACTRTSARARTRVADRHPVSTGRVRARHALEGALRLRATSPTTSRYPIPRAVHIEGGGRTATRCCVDRARCRLYELYAPAPRGRRLARRLRRDLEPALDDAAADRLDVGRRRGPADPSRCSRAGTRCAAGRSTTRCASPCVPHARRLRVPGASRRVRATATRRCRGWGSGCGCKRVRSTSRRLPRAGADRGARDAGLRADRGRQRLGLVRRRRAERTAGTTTTCTSSGRSRAATSRSSTARRCASCRVRPTPDQLTDFPSNGQKFLAERPFDGELCRVVTTSVTVAPATVQKGNTCSGSRVAPPRRGSHDRVARSRPSAWRCWPCSRSGRRARARSSAAIPSAATATATAAAPGTPRAPRRRLMRSSPSRPPTRTSARRSASTPTTGTTTPPAAPPGRGTSTPTAPSTRASRPRRTRSPPPGC